jgi:gamma-glutamylcyclotransferase (GGCT)/AIG2-like uncharacterized protein YtfP
VVFVYGSLMPGHERWPIVEPFVAHVEVASVQGRLYDTGYGFPAARFDEPGAIPGWLLVLHPASRARALAALDEVEGELYDRVRVTTEDGEQAESYQWRGPLTGLRALDGPWEP